MAHLKWLETIKFIGSNPGGMELCGVDYATTMPAIAYAKTY